jgi:hypothetical protein
MADYTNRDERRLALKQDVAKAQSPAARTRSKPGPPPTLGEEMRDGYRWFWFLCPTCERRTPKALAPFAIRYGMAVPTIDVAKFATCQRCGHRGALLQRPSMNGIGADLMLEPFPGELAARGMERWLARVTRTRMPAPLRGSFTTA